MEEALKTILMFDGASSLETIELLKVHLLTIEKNIKDGIEDVNQTKVTELNEPSHSKTINLKKINMKKIICFVFGHKLKIKTNDIAAANICLRCDYKKDKTTWPRPE